MEAHGRNRILQSVLLLLLVSCGTSDADLVPVRFDIDGRRVLIHAEVADSDDERARGLMGRESLPGNGGMLFLWPDVAPRQVYMKDTLLPLDVVVIRAGRVVGLHHLVPCTSDPCPITDTVSADAMLEIAGGSAPRLGIRAGALVEAPGLL